MKDKIKELRLKIDGISQLVKELKPFTWVHGVVDVLENTDADTYQMYLVSDSLSSSNTNHKYHTLIKTDRGVYRTSSSHPFDESLFKTFDRNSKEINKAFDSLILAKAWLGEVLKVTKDLDANKEPYITDIIDKKDIADKTLLEELLTYGSNYGEKSYIEKVDWLKEKIKVITQLTKSLNDDVSEIHDQVKKEILDRRSLGERGESLDKLWVTIPDIELEVDITYKYLCEARFWLGFELQRIKENN